MQFEEYTIISIIHEFPQVFTLKVKPKNKKPIKPFKPGQFYHVKNPTYSRPEETRPFSIITTPRTKTHIEFVIKMYGPWTNVLQQKKAGESLWLFGPMGGFTFKTDTTSAIFLAGGIGIAPMLSILQSLHEQKSDIPLTLFYANKSTATVLKKQYLDELFARNKLWKLISIVSQIKDTDVWDGYRGRITQTLLKNEIVRSENQRFFLCGSQLFTNNMIRLLRDLNIEESRIKQEIFLPPNFSNGQG